MRKLYVCSKDIGNGAHLIGVLSENDGKYQFEYRFNGVFPRKYLKIREFPDISRVYYDEEARPFVERLLPERDHWLIDKILDLPGLEEYDEWELLKYYGQKNSREDAYLYENLPERVIQYD